MKTKRILYYLAVSLFLVSCTNEDVLDDARLTPDIQVVNLKDVKTEIRAILDSRSIDADEYVLKFKDEQVYLNTIEKLRKLTSKERSKWASAFPDFISSDSIFNQAMIEAANLEFNTTDEYSDFKNKYQKYLYFSEYEEDFGAYIPYKEKNATATFSKSGIIMIGDNIILEDKITTYEELQKTGEAYYSPTEEITNEFSLSNKLEQPITSLKATASIQYLNGKIEKFNKVGRGDFLSNLYNSGWIQKGDRKLQLKVNYIYELDSEARITLKWHTEVSFRKSSIVGWINYASYTELTGFLSGFDDNGKMTDFYIMTHSSDNPSSHDGYGSPVKCILLAEGQLIIDNDYDISNGGAGNISGRAAYHLPYLSGNFSVYFTGFGTTTNFMVATKALNFVASASRMNNDGYSGMYTQAQYTSAGYYFNWSKYIK